MIRLKELLDLPEIVLSEANSGYSDYGTHKQIANKIYNYWMELLNSIDYDKDKLLKDIPRDKLDKVINKGINFDIGISIEDVNFIKSIDVLLAILPEDGIVPIKKSSVVINVDPMEVYLIIYSNFTINEILNYKNEMEELADHEAVHIIKTKQKLHQLSYKQGDDLNKKDEIFWYKYYVNVDEVHAYIAQINNELKHIKLKNKDISFSDAIKLSKVWRRYTKSVFNKSLKLRNKMLSKVVNYWNNL